MADTNRPTPAEEQQGIQDAEAAWQGLHKDDAGQSGPEEKIAPEGPRDGHDTAGQELLDAEYFGIGLSSRFDPPPSDTVLEQRLLGMLLVTGGIQLPVDLSPYHFVDPVHRAVYETMQRAQKGGLAFNAANVGADLEGRSDLEEVGGTAFLAQLVAAGNTQGELSFICIEDAADRVSELAHARWLLGHLDDIRQLVRVHDELIRDPNSHGRGGGRAKAHSIAMDLAGIMRDLLDRTMGWA